MATPLPDPLPADGQPREPIVWRSIVLSPVQHHLFVGASWQSIDQLWRVSSIGGGYFVAMLQLDGQNQACMASGTTAHEALDLLALVAAQLAKKLAGALGQIE
jgi:hypothetical protein